MASANDGHVIGTTSPDSIAARWRPSALDFSFSHRRRAGSVFSAGSSVLKTTFCVTGSFQETRKRWPRGNIVTPGCEVILGMDKRSVSGSKPAVKNRAGGYT